MPGLINFLAEAAVIAFDYVVANLPTILVNVAVSVGLESPAQMVGDCREAKLGRFLVAASKRDWIPGEYDCSLWLADWYVACTGAPDPAHALRGTYRSEAECVALYGKAPALRMVGQIAAAIGLRPTDAPTMGDIAVVDIPELATRVAVGAIRTATGWAVPAPLVRGFQLAPAGSIRVLKAWRI